MFGDSYIIFILVFVICLIIGFFGDRYMKKQNATIKKIKNDKKLDKAKNKYVANTIPGSTMNETNNINDNNINNLF